MMRNSKASYSQRTNIEKDFPGFLDKIRSVESELVGLKTASDSVYGKEGSLVLPLSEVYDDDHGQTDCVYLKYKDSDNFSVYISNGETSDRNIMSREGGLYKYQSNDERTSYVTNEFEKCVLKDVSQLDYHIAEKNNYVQKMQAEKLESEKPKLKDKISGFFDRFRRKDESITEESKSSVDTVRSVNGDVNEYVKQVEKEFGERFEVLRKSINAGTINSDFRVVSSMHDIGCFSEINRWHDYMIEPDARVKNQFNCKYRHHDSDGHGGEDVHFATINENGIEYHESGCEHLCTGGGFKRPTFGFSSAGEGLSYEFYKQNVSSDLCKHDIDEVASDFRQVVESASESFDAIREGCGTYQLNEHKTLSNDVAYIAEVNVLYVKLSSESFVPQDGSSKPKDVYLMYENENSYEVFVADSDVLTYASEFVAPECDMIDSNRSYTFCNRRMVNSDYKDKAQYGINNDTHMMEIYGGAVSKAIQGSNIRNRIENVLDDIHDYNMQQVRDDFKTEIKPVALSSQVKVQQNHTQEVLSKSELVRTANQTSYENDDV